VGGPKRCVIPTEAYQPSDAKTMSKGVSRTVIVASVVAFVYYIFGIQSSRDVRKFSPSIPVTGNYCSSEVWAQQGFWERKSGAAYISSTPG
jgi:hypothetical protein